MATIAIGDVHGNFAALDDLLSQLKNEMGPGEVIVFLGDYIDRGPRTRECVDRILALRNEVAAEVVCLCGNHDDWLLRTRHNYRDHTWLHATDPFKTIQSYSADAAEVLRSAVRQAGAAVYQNCALPYAAFFDAVPETHLQFFESLQAYHQTPECVCAHGGVDPNVSSIQAQSRDDFMWGHQRFPDKYDGPETIVYGHHNNAVLGEDGWPWPAIVGRTVGIDTISHGVLTAIRLPDGQVFQSARHVGRSGS